MNEAKPLGSEGLAERMRAEAKAWSMSPERRVLYAEVATRLEILDERYRIQFKAAVDAMEIAEKAEADEAEVSRQFKRLLDRSEASIQSLQRQLEEAREALRPFALVAEHDIGSDEADADTFRNCQYNTVPKITVGHLRLASQVLVLVEGWSNSAQSPPVAMTPKSASVGSEPSAAPVSVRQQTDDDCTICCIAMATGLSYDAVMAQAKASAGGYRYGGTPGTMSPKGVLIDLGFAAKRLGGEGAGQGAGVRSALWGRRAILSVPSLSGFAGHHDVYWDGERVRDPSPKERYPEKLPTVIHWATVLDEVASVHSAAWRDIESGVTLEFVARHLDPIMDEGWHTHTFAVTIWRDGEPWSDDRSAEGALDTLLRAIAPEAADGVRELPPETWSNEAIARAVSTLGNVVEVYVTRSDGPRYSVRLRR